MVPMRNALGKSQHYSGTPTLALYSSWLGSQTSQKPLSTLVPHEKLRRGRAQAPIPFSSGLSTGAFPTTTFAQNFLATPHPGLRAAPPTGVQAAPSWSPPQAPPSDIVGEMREAVQKTDWYQLYQEGKTKFWMGGGWSAGPERCGLLQTLCALSGARRVVEIGQCCGVATLAMAEALPQGGKVVTLEIDSYLADFGKQYWARSSHGSKIRSVVGPAMEYLKSGNAKQDGPFDLAVIDADKDGIWDYYCTLRDQGLLAPKAAIVVDTTPYKGQPPDRYVRFGAEERWQSNSGKEAIESALHRFQKEGSVTMASFAGVTVLYPPQHGGNGVA